MRRKAGIAVALSGMFGLCCSFGLLQHTNHHSGKVWVSMEGQEDSVLTAYLQVSEAQRRQVLSPQNYANIAISQVEDYVNIRQNPNTNSPVVGKIYHNCAATILETVDGEGGKWYRIQSGTVNGYIKAEYFITGAQAEAEAKKIGTVYAKVKPSALRLREKPNLTSEILTTLAQGAEYIVLEEKNNFAKLSVDEDLTGYVSMDYIETRVEFRQAVSLQEEAEKTAETNRRRQEAQEALQKLEEVKLVEAKVDGLQSVPNQQISSPSTGLQTARIVGGSEAQTLAAETTSVSTTAADINSVGTIAANPLGEGEDLRVLTPKAAESSEAATSATLVSITPKDNSSALVTATRNAIIAYAKQFLGNSYVYGGDSLTNGTDCSGFVMRIYEHFGIKTGRSSRDQAANGRQIAVEAVQPGDLLFYASGKTINHVAIYIGGGQVIHAASARTGIVISPSNYRTPCKAATFLN